MSSDFVERVVRDGFTLDIVYDEDPISPAEWDQLGRLVTWHRSYCFDQDGRKAFGEPQDFLAAAKAGKWVVLPVAMLDHSGVTLYEGVGEHQSDPGGWDSGQVGYIYATPERIKEAGTPRKKVKAALRSELKEWDQYVSGDVYGAVVKGPDGEVRESVWGFYGRDHAMEEGLAMLEAEIRHEEEERKKIARMMAL